MCALTSWTDLSESQEKPVEEDEKTGAVLDMLQSATHNESKTGLQAKSQGHCTTATNLITEIATDETTRKIKAL